MIIEGFTERAFDNLNQTVTLGHTSQLLQNPGSSRPKRTTLADAAKKRDMVARSSIESNRQYSSPIPQ